MKITDFTHNILELIAALTASFYYYKTKDHSFKTFVWYLWLIVIVETLGLYGYVLQNNYDNSWFIWLKNSVFCSNVWLFNIYGILALILLGLFYIRNLKDTFSKNVIKAIVLISTFFALIYFLVTNGFFEKTIPYHFTIQTFAVFIFVILYFRELIKSDELLEFYKSYLFYISLGLMLWYLCVTPLFIFDGYFYAINKEFVVFRKNYLLTFNILLYSCYIFAFFLSLYHKGKLVQKKLH